MLAILFVARHKSLYTRELDCFPSATCPLALGQSFLAPSSLTYRLGSRCAPQTSLARYGTAWRTRATEMTQARAPNDETALMVSMQLLHLFFSFFFCKGGRKCPWAFPRLSQKAVSHERCVDRVLLTPPATKKHAYWPCLASIANSMIIIRP